MKIYKEGTKKNSVKSMCFIFQSTEGRPCPTVGKMSDKLKMVGAQKKKKTYIGGILIRASPQLNGLVKFRVHSTHHNGGVVWTPAPIKKRGM